MTIVHPESDTPPEARPDNHPAKLIQGDDEDYVEYLTRQADAWCSNPPPAPPGFELVECSATPRHWPEYAVADDDFYPGGCSRCAYDALYEAHAGCAHSHHARWRRWRITGKVAGWLYVTGLTSNGGGWQMSAHCPGCYTMPKWNRNRRVYALGKRVDWWTCLIKRHHLRGDEIGFGLCAKCAPCPDCGSRTAEHEPTCEWR